MFSIPRVLRHRDFRYLFFGQAASVVGDRAVVVALALYVTQRTGSASTAPRSLADPVRWVTYRASATTTARSPTTEAAWPKNRYRKSRWRRTRGMENIGHSRTGRHRTAEGVT